MAEVTIEANFSVSAATIAEKRKQFDVRVVELLVEAMNEGATARERLEHRHLAEALHKALNAYPGIIQKVRNELQL